MFIHPFIIILVCIVVFSTGFLTYFYIVELRDKLRFYINQTRRYEKSISRNEYYKLRDKSNITNTIDTSYYDNKIKTPSDGYRDFGSDICSAVYSSSYGCGASGYSDSSSYSSSDSSCSSSD